MNGELNLEDCRRIAASAASAAAILLTEKFASGGQLEIKTKPAGDIVTDADIAAETIIKEHLLRAFPDHGIVAEESGELNPAAPYRWFVDPIDGTDNFSRGNPNFAISIALAHGENLLVGIIHAPQLQEVYEAVRGSGAWRNGQPIHVSDVTELTMADILWCEGHESSKQRAQQLRQRVTAAVASCERIGSAALECANVASGNKAAYFTTAIRPWDIAAGKLLVEEAGGTVTDFNGQPFPLRVGDFLASNGHVHQAMVQLLASLPS